MWLLFAFIMVPIIEIALFIQVGGLIGLWPTLAIVIVTAMIGTALVRQQGARELANLRQSFSSLDDPTRPLASGAMIIFAGALLLTPGFLTDAMGFALLVPPVRDAVYRYAKSRIKVQSFQMGTASGARQPTGDRVIDGEFEEIDPQARGVQPPSGWTRH